MSRVASHLHRGLGDASGRILPARHREEATPLEHVANPGSVSMGRLVGIALGGFDQNEVGLIEGLTRLFVVSLQGLQVPKVREQMSEKIRVTGRFDLEFMSLQMVRARVGVLE